MAKNTPNNLTAAGPQGNRQGRVAPRPAQRQGARGPLRPRQRPAASRAQRPRLRGGAAPHRHQRGAHPRHRGQGAARADQGARHLHPIRRSIEHADLLVVRRGEKVTVEVNVIVEGEAIPGTLVTQDANTIRDRGRRAVDPRPADRLGRRCRRRHAVHRRLRSRCPSGVTLISDPETLVVNVVAAPTAEELEGEGAGEAAAEEAEGEAAEGASEGEGEGVRRGTRRGLRVARHGRARYSWSASAILDRSTPRRGTTSASSSPTSWPTASARGSRCTRSRGPRWSRVGSPAARWCSPNRAAT